MEPPKRAAGVSRPAGNEPGAAFPGCAATSQVLFPRNPRPAAAAAARALRANGDFDAYWRYHLAAEYERNHASHYAAQIVPNPLTTACHLRRVK